jgi:hypothetical protein
MVLPAPGDATNAYGFWRLFTTRVLGGFLEEFNMDK